MKKTLIALAAVAASGAVFAQSSVTLSGRVDFGYRTNTTTTGGVTTKTTTNFGGDSSRTSDRIGLTGTEDLGGGLKAGFEYTMALSPDNTASDAIGGVREGFVSLSGGFGAVKIGTMTNTFDAMVGNGWHNDSGTFNGNVILFPARTTNTLTYTSPAFSGFNVGVTAFGDKTTANGVLTASTKQSGYILTAAYNAGPLSVLFGHGDMTTNSAFQVGLGGTTTNIAAATAAGSLTDVASTAIKAGYNLGMAVPYVMWASNKVENAGFAGDFKSNGWEIGSTFPMGALTPYISYVSSKTSGTFNGWKYTGYEFGADYALSKRTTAYATYGRKTVKDDGVTDRKVKAIAVGVSHLF